MHFFSDHFIVDNPCSIYIYTIYLKRHITIRVVDMLKTNIKSFLLPETNNNKQILTKDSE